MTDVTTTDEARPGSSVPAPESTQYSPRATLQGKRATSSAFRHVAAIRALASEVGRPFEEVAAVYQRELDLLAKRATVLDFLPVLTMKRVRRLYQQRLSGLR